MIDVRAALLGAGEELSSELRSELLAAGREALPVLHQVLRDPALVADDAPGEGWAPIHAVELLGALSDPASVEPLLTAYAAADWMELIKDAALQALQGIGAPVIEPALRALAAAAGDEQRNDLCAVLAGLGVRDERILAALLAQLARDPGLGASNLAGYGDEHALPSLYAELDRQELQVGALLVDQTLVELKAAVQELGGTLRPAHLAKVHEMERVRHQRFEALEEDLPGPPAVRRERPGRNAPCWCGSGKKYKKCHLDADEA
jgi:SEC-C motif